MTKIINAGILNELSFDPEEDAVCGSVIFNKKSIVKLLSIISVNSAGKTNWSEINALTTSLSEAINDDSKIEIKPLAAKGSRLELAWQAGKEYDFTYHG